MDSWMDVATKYKVFAIYVLHASDPDIIEERTNSYFSLYDHITF